MKQTLLILSLLAAGVASAATLDVTNGYASNWQGVFYASPSSFTFQFVIPQGTEVPAKGTMLAYINAENAGDVATDKNRQISIFFDGGDSEYYLYVARANLTDDTSLMKVNNDGNDIVWFKVNSDVVYTFTSTNNKNSSTFTLSAPGVADVQKTLDTQIVAKTEGEYPNGTPMVSYLNDAFIPAPAVPEPATATLSLLALAGLAARRRRK